MWCRFVVARLSCRTRPRPARDSPKFRLPRRGRCRPDAAADRVDSEAFSGLLALWTLAHESDGVCTALGRVGACVWWALNGGFRHATLTGDQAVGLVVPLMTCERFPWRLAARGAQVTQ